jgi:hypothetical protein
MRWRIAGIFVVLAMFVAVGAPSALARSGGSGGGSKPSGGGDVRSKPFAFTATDITSYPFAEPSVEVFNNYHVVFCGPGGDGGNYFGRSADWTHFSLISIPDPVIGGGDCDIKISPTGTLFEADLQIFGSAIRRSADEGQTWATTDYYEEPIEEDRQWLAPDPNDPSIVYFVYHDFAAEAEVMAKSIDGGVTFPIHSLVSTDPTLAPNTYPNTFSGPIVVDPSNSQNVYVAYGISNLQGNLDPAYAPFGLPLTVVVGSSHDGGLTWTDKVAMTSPAGSVLGNLFPWLTVDKAGNLYVGAAGHVLQSDGSAINGMFISVSKNHGSTWSNPIHVGASTTGAAVFPTVHAGAAGVLDVAWIQDSLSDFSDQNSVWTVHFAQSRNATASTPTFTEVTGPIVRHGAVCVLGILCNGNRNLLDFLSLALDPFGYAHVAVASTEPGSGPDAAPHVLYWRQDAGPSATTLPCTPTCVKSRPRPV